GLAIAGRRLIGYNMAQLYSIVTPNLTGTKLSLDSLYELALKLGRILTSLIRASSKGFFKEWELPGGEVGRKVVCHLPIK
ncbi:MAG: hypothetical protein MGG37_01505, partial [Trichodesmium sp. MAG_R01]|nr:hypothetical protein [Trichodesmium sp. MAG_R01]